MSHTSLTGSYAWNDTLKGVHYGPGSIKTALPQLLKLLSGSKVVLITGNSLRKTDIIKNIENLLKDLGVYGATFSDIGQHSPIADIRKGLQVIKDVNADVIVSVGGGSPIDAAKIMISSLQKETKGEYMKQIAIPTTLSAAEYTYAAGYKDERGLKVGLVDEQLAPAGVILDAEVTLATPEWLWLSTGIRALDHAVENLNRPPVPYPVKILCYSAITDLFINLPETKKNPGDLAVRQKLQLASWMSLWPIKSTNPMVIGLSHDLSRRIGARCNIPHGLTSCLTLAPVVALKAEVASEDDQTMLARGWTCQGNPSTGSAEGDILQLSSQIAQLIDNLGLTTNLNNYNVAKCDIPSIVEQTIGTTTGEMYNRLAELVDGLFVGA